MQQRRAQTTFTTAEELTRNGLSKMTNQGANIDDEEDDEEERLLDFEDIEEEETKEDIVPPPKQKMTRQEAARYASSVRLARVQERRANAPPPEPKKPVGRPKKLIL